MPGSSPGMTSCRHTFSFSRRDAPERMIKPCPSKTEGAGKAGCPMHPQPRAQRWKAHELVTTGSPSSSGLPCAMVLTVSFVLSPVIGLLSPSPADLGFCHCPVGPTKLRQLDASAGASGPHDFAVRESISRQLAQIAHGSKDPPCHHVARPMLPRPPHPAPHVRDDRETPLVRSGTEWLYR